MTEQNTEQLQHAKVDAAKSYLRDVAEAKRRAQRAKIEYDLIIQKISAPSGIDYSRDMVSKSVSPDAIPNALIKSEEQLTHLKILCSIADDIFNECYKKLNKLENDEGTIVRLHYLVGLTNSDIALSLGISERTVYRKLICGLIHFYDQGIPIQYRIDKEQAI